MSYTLRNFYSYLKSKNATNDTHNFKLYSCKIETNYGDLFISVNEDRFNKQGKPYKRNKVFSIFCCFDDFEKAKPFLEKYYENRVFTGKWNHHSSDWSNLLTMFISELNKIT